MSLKPSASSPEVRSRDMDLEKRLRPRTLSEFIGQQKIKDNLGVFVTAAVRRKETLDHVLLSGPPGLGKCVAAASRVLTDGGYARLGDLVPRGMVAGEVRSCNLTVFGQHGPERASHIYCSGRGRTCRLKTQSGKTLEGTPHHPIMAASPRGPVWRRLVHLTRGDRVAIAERTNTARSSLQADVLEMFSDTDRRVPRANCSKQHPVRANCERPSEPLRWDTVSEVRDSEALTFDFVVPGTHSFTANGFINHNTTLGYIIAEEMSANITTSSGPVLDKPASIAGILTNLSEGDVLFVDEIHRLTPVVEEYLYSAMEDYFIDIVIDSGPNARSVKISLPPFTLVGATTRKGLLTAPLRARFGIDFRYDYYSAELLQQIVKRSALILGIRVEDDGAHEIARRSRGTPRIANRLLRRARDFAEVTGDGCVTQGLADYALTALEVDQEGLDDMDARILTTLIEKFQGGPAGLTNLAVSVGEDAGTIEEVYEPYLIQEGYLKRTPRGRVATPRSFKHFGHPRTQELFE